MLQHHNHANELHNLHWYFRTEIYIQSSSWELSVFSWERDIFKTQIQSFNFLFLPLFLGWNKFGTQVRHERFQFWGIGEIWTHTEISRFSHFQLDFPPDGNSVIFNMIIESGKLTCSHRFLAAQVILHACCSKIKGSSQVSSTKQKQTKNTQVKESFVKYS